LRPTVRGTAAIGAMLLGTSVAAYNMFYWYQDQYYFAQAGGSPYSILSFYLSMAISIFLLTFGFFLAYEDLKKRANSPSSAPLSSSSPPSLSPFFSSASQSDSTLDALLGIIGTAVSDRRMVRAATIAAVLYGLLYAFASSIMVLQPGVDFALAYGVTTPTAWGSIACCGDIGTLPKLIFYLSPAHFAVQLVPLSLLLLFIVPPLVGLNFAIALFSVRRTVARATGRWMVACGAAVGLFTACPTCAGFFLAESIGGIGATTLAVVLAPYQALFIAVSIPLLVATPFFFAMRVKKAEMSRLRPTSPPPSSPSAPTLVPTTTTNGGNVQAEDGRSGWRRWRQKMMMTRTRTIQAGNR
jgi:hypothetical protein